MTLTRIGSSLVVQPLSRLPLTFCVRWRHVPKMKTLEQRLFKAVTQPILPPSTVTLTDRYVRQKEFLTIQKEQHPYRQFLLRRIQSELFGAAENRMVLFCDLHHYLLRQLIPFKNKLFDQGIMIKQFPPELVQLAAKNTKWEAVTSVLLNENVRCCFLIGESDPATCKNGLKIIQKTPILCLLGGIIGHRIMTCEELTAYSQLGDLPTVRSQLLGLLESGPRQTLSLLSHHQNELSVCLEQLSSSSKDSVPTENNSSSSPSGSDS